MPRPNPPRGIGAEDRLRENLRRFLKEQERSDAWMARHLTDLGCPIGQTAVSRIRLGERKVNVDEAVGLAMVLGVTLEELIA